jgi:biopolymer transport protein ExbD
MGISNFTSQKRTRRRSSSSASINVTPFLDVLLVLLIIFMMTAQMIYNDVDLNLPKALSSSGPRSSTQDDMKIFINEKQEIIVGEEKVENLETYLASINEKEKSEQIVIIGDLSIPYQKLIEVMVSLNNFGFTKIKMAYEKKS